MVILIFEVRIQTLLLAAFVSHEQWKINAMLTDLGQDATQPRKQSLKSLSNGSGFTFHMPNAD